MAVQRTLLQRCLPIVQFTLQDVQYPHHLFHQMCDSSLALASARALSANCGSAAAAVTYYLADQATGQHQQCKHRCRIAYNHRCSSSDSVWSHQEAHGSQKCAHTATGWSQLHCRNRQCLHGADHQCHLHPKIGAGAVGADGAGKQQQLHQGHCQYLSNRRPGARNSPQARRHSPILLAAKGHLHVDLHSQLQLFKLPWCLLQQRYLHGKQQQMPPQQQDTASRAGGAAAAAGSGPHRVQVPGASWTTLPNLLSLSRVASGPWVAYLIATQQWPLAFALTATAGVTDWLDGYLARRLGHTSKLGSYLDPLADKVLVGSVVGTMGVLGMVPAWLAVLVVGRDAAQVTGMAWYRLNMFGGRWPGAAAFFDVDGVVTTGAAAAAARKNGAGSASRYSDHSSRSSSGGRNPSSSSKTDNEQAGEAAAGAAEPGDVGGDGLPAIRPLMVSKMNTALVFVLVAGCMTQQWQGVPGHDVLRALEVAIAGTSAASGAAYGWLYWTGRLLPGPKR